MTIWYLNLVRKYFAQIAAGTKRTEYRSRTVYWRRRLEGRHYDVIQSRLHFVLVRQVRNGYATQAPEMIVEFRGLRRYGDGRKGYYASASVASSTSNAGVAELNNADTWLMRGQSRARVCQFWISIRTRLGVR